jgi:addiction module HigA family antidote
LTAPGSEGGAPHAQHPAGRHRSPAFRACRQQHFPEGPGAAREAWQSDALWQRENAAKFFDQKTARSPAASRWEAFRSAWRQVAPEGSPIHPGEIIANMILPNLNMSREQLAQQSEIPPEDVDRLLAGTLNIDKTIRNKLRKAFGEASDLLFDQQRAFDYFEVHRKWPAPAGPI